MRDMKVHNLHGWQVSIPQALAIQRELAARVSPISEIGEPRFIAGADIARSIQRAIEASSNVLVLLSKASIDSDWVKKEVRQAIEIEMANEDTSGGFILPVRIENIEIPKELEFLKSRLYVDLFGGRDAFIAGIQKILVALRSAHRLDDYLE